MDKLERKARIWALENTLHEALALSRPGTGLTTKQMFGGALWYADGVVFAGWFGGSLALKLPEARREQLLAEGWGKNWSNQYIEVPLPLLDELEQLGDYLIESIQYSSLPQNRQKSKNKRERE